MVWGLILAHYFAGALAVNAVPHLVRGLCGKPFPTPFASPPARGLSHPVLNAVWGVANAAAAGLILWAVRPAFPALSDVIAFIAGAFTIAVALSVWFDLVRQDRSARLVPPASPDLAPTRKP